MHLYKQKSSRRRHHSIKWLRFHVPVIKTSIRIQIKPKMRVAKPPVLRREVY